METKPYYLVRELDTTEDLIPFLNLRYQVFRSTGLKVLITENEYRIDVDAWDKHATHIGLFKMCKEERLPVGYVRFIDYNYQASDAVVGLTSRYPAFGEAIIAKPAVKFPGIRDHLQNLSPEMIGRIEHSSSYKTIEVGRLVIHPEEQGSVDLSHFFVTAITSISLLVKGYNAFLQVTEHHQPYYARFFGAQIISRSKLKGTDLKTCLLLAKAENLSPLYFPRLQKKADIFRETGHICFHPASSVEHVAPFTPTPYEKNNFHPNGHPVMPGSSLSRQYIASNSLEDADHPVGRSHTLAESAGHKPSGSL